MHSSASIPPAVHPGDRVGVAALSGPVAGENLARGVEALYELGFEPVLASNLSERHQFFAGTDEQRLSGFHELVADDSLGAIIFARGGHGILRILSRLDWRLMSRRPRAYVGYSDLTPLLNLLVSRLGLVAFHGPMVAVDLARGLAGPERDSLVGALAGELPAPIPVAGAGSPVDGVLVGGCLSLLNAVVGTEFQFQMQDQIVFWEDVDEPLYRLDRMMTQLRLSGSLTRIRAMIVGRFDLHPDDRESGLLPDLLTEWGHEFECPMTYGVESGHCQPNMTLPLGMRVHLDPDHGEMRFLE
jgi:muramoyltetrapeptide carboxypeptidase